MLKTVIATAVFLPVGLAYPADNVHQPNTTSLNWTACDIGFPPSVQETIDAHGEPVTCANLSVPLDYTDRENGKTVNLQLIRIKATKEPFKGSVLTNPGGPGGSGVDWIARDGPALRDAMGGHHDVIGFDPRGTGRTLPFICLPTNTTVSKAKRAQYNFTIPQEDVYNDLLEKAWHDHETYTEGCANTPGNADIGPYLSTPFVARDMLEIIDALGEDQLQYFGISYGTVLGQTFAGMFPDRVGRLLLDSVLRFDDYHAGQWITATRDTERALVNFFKECVNVGPALCPIANFSGPNTTASDLHSEYAKVFQELLDNPIILPDEFRLVDWYRSGDNTLYILLKYLTLAWVYIPWQFGQLQTVIDIALRRDWVKGVELLTTSLNTTVPEVPWNLGINAFHGIACSDGAFRADKPEDVYSLALAQASSGSFADGFGPQIWPCAQWRFEAKERYTGPFTAINTSNPILFISGNHDPITPLSAAYEASANFPGSRLVVQNGHGHGVLNHPSSCTTKVIADYFTNGTLPDVGKVCQTDKAAYDVFVDFFAETLNSTGSGALAKRSLELPRKSILT